MPDIAELEIRIKESGAQQARSSLQALDQTHASLTMKVLGLNQAWELATKLYNAAIGPMKAWVAVAAEIEQSQRSLQQSLRATGQDTEANISSMNKLTRSLSDTTTAGSGTVRWIQQQMIAFGAAPDQVDRLTRATLDLAEGMGKDTAGAAFVMGKAVAGEFTTMSRYGVFVDANATKTEKMAQMLAQVEGRFGGQALAAADTYTGRIEIMEHAWVRVQDALGKIITESVAVQRETEHETARYRQIADAINAWVDKNRELIDQKLDSVLGGVDSVISTLVEKAPQLAEDMGRVAAAVGSLGVNALNSMPNLSTIANLLEKIAGMYSSLPEPVQVGILTGVITKSPQAGIVAAGLSAAHNPYRDAQYLADDLVGLKDALMEDFNRTLANGVKLEVHDGHIDVVYGSFQFAGGGGFGKSGAGLDWSPEAGGMTGESGQTIDASRLLGPGESPPAWHDALAEAAAQGENRRRQEMIADMKEAAEEYKQLATFAQMENKYAENSVANEKTAVETAQRRGVVGEKIVAIAAQVDAAERNRLSQEIAGLELSKMNPAVKSNQAELNMIDAVIAGKRGEIAALHGVEDARKSLAELDVKAYDTTLTYNTMAEQAAQGQLTLDEARHEKLSTILDDMKRVNEAQVAGLELQQAKIIAEVNVPGMNSVDIDKKWAEWIQLQQQIDTANAATPTALKQKTDQFRSSFGLPMSMDDAVKQYAAIDDALAHNVLTAQEAQLAYKHVRDELRGTADAGTEAMQRLTEATQGWGQKFDETFATMTATGKGSFKDLVQSILMDMNKILIHETITEPFMLKPMRGVLRQLQGLPPERTVSDSAIRDAGFVGPPEQKDMASIAQRAESGFDAMFRHAEAGWKGTFDFVYGGFGTIFQGLVGTLQGLATGVFSMLFGGGGQDIGSMFLGNFVGSLASQGLGKLGGGGGGESAPTETTINDWGPQYYSHAGSLVFHRGGQALAPDEVPAILQKGELVVPANVTRDLFAAARNRPAVRFHTGGVVGGDGAEAFPLDGGGGAQVTQHFPMKVEVVSLDPRGAAEVLARHEDQIRGMITKAIREGGQLAREVGRRR